MREKLDKYTAWRKTDKIKDGDVITIADMFVAHFDDEEEQLEEFLSALFGFAQTTLSATVQSLYQILRHMKVEILAEELEREFGKNDLKSASLTAKYVAENLDFGKQRLIYLERCLMEAIRLDPPIPITTVHKTTADTKMSNGEKLPKGTRFTFNMVAIHRDVEQYFKPNEFIPERFSSKSEYYLTPGATQRHALSWCPFLTGQRHCNGQEFAFMVAKTVITLYLTAMPKLDFEDSSMMNMPEMPSSAPQSKVTVKVEADLPFKL